MQKQKPKTLKISKTLFSGILMCAVSLWMILECNVAEAQCGDLPEEERNAFGEIVSELGRKDWITKHPCDNEAWSFAQTEFQNATIICNCSYPDGLYHVETIFFLKLDLPGVLPPSVAKLPYLKRLDLNRNFLSGNIPPEWASLKLIHLSVSANRLSGPIPEFLGNLINLTFLSFENNFFNGSIPRELGKLVNLQRLVLSANFFTGELPKELLELKNLNEFRMSSNNFSGKLPDLLGWDNLKRLEMQATGMEGPIPSSISALTNLTELKISDLKGGSSVFPRLDSLSAMQKLMLRSCNLIGHIPSYFSEMPNLVAV